MPATAAVFARAEAPSPAVSVRDRAAAIVSASAFGCASAIAAAAPFELWRPLVKLPWQSISSVEAAVAAAFVVFATACVFAAMRPAWRTPLTAPWVAFLAAAIVAALTASAERTNAVHMALRFTAAFLIYVLAANGLTTTRRVRTWMAVTVAVGTAVAVVAIFEYLGVGKTRRLLQAFRPAVSMVGSQVRAGGTLQYPTIASMYFELVFAFGLGLLADAADRRNRRMVVLLVAALGIVAEAIVVTFTRSGLLVVVLLLALTAALRYRRRAVDMSVVALAVVTSILAGELIASHSYEALKLRMTTESQDNWYSFAIEAPAELTIPTGGQLGVPVRLTNTGQVTWDSAADQPFAFSYHWLLLDSDKVVSYEGSRSAFPFAVGAGESVSVTADLVAPRQPGRYRVMWDVAQEGRLWFSTEPGAKPLVSRATVVGPPSNIPIHLSPLPRPRTRPGRFTLWSAAVRMVAAHPIFGVGPDNFRLLYGPFARLENVDPRVHSNNMYLEVLTGGGIVMFAPFAWLLWRAFGCARRALGRAGAAGSLAIGGAAALLAVSIHGLADSFFGFTPTYTLIAMTLAVVAAAAWETQPDAHRV